MDPISEVFYALKFRSAFIEKKGTEFQDWFAQLAGHALGADFEAVRPYGNIGDWKCDGRQVSTGTVFQCYAPSTESDQKTISKIDKDFAGAMAKWPGFMKVWVFVHNDVRGLPPTVVDHLDKKRKDNPEIQIEIWTQSNLLKLYEMLSGAAKRDLFGPVPSQRDVNDLALPDLKPVIDALERRELNPSDPVPTPPSAQKLEKNALSHEAAEFLRMGRRKVRLVETYFQKVGAVELGEEIAEAFRARYAELAALELLPDQIFGYLQKLSGAMNGEPKRQAAAMAVMAYFFDTCDIFEDPDEEVSGV